MPIQMCADRQALVLRLYYVGYLTFLVRRHRLQSRYRLHPLRRAPLKLVRNQPCERVVGTHTHQASPVRQSLDSRSLDVAARIEGQGAGCAPDTKRVILQVLDLRGLVRQSVRFSGPLLGSQFLVFTSVSEPLDRPVASRVARGPHRQVIGRLATVRYIPVPPCSSNLGLSRARSKRSGC